MAIRPTVALRPPGPQFLHLCGEAVGVEPCRTASIYKQNLPGLSSNARSGPYLEQVGSESLRTGPMCLAGFLSPTETTLTAGEGAEPRELSPTAGGVQSGRAAVEDAWAVPYEAKHSLTIQSGSHASSYSFN